MTNISTTVIELNPIGGSPLEGWLVGLLVSTAKAAQNDTVTITNASEIHTASKLGVVATGASETKTISSNVITLTSATTGAVDGIVIYKP